MTKGNRMPFDQTRIALLARDAQDFQDAHTSAVEEVLEERKSNVVGVGLGVKWTNGQPTGEPALLTLVTHKVPLDNLKRSDRVPPMINGVKTDVLAVGRPLAGAATASGVALTRRLRPVLGGFSVGHKDITAGTI